LGSLQHAPPILAQHRLLQGLEQLVDAPFHFQPTLALGPEPFPQLLQLLLKAQGLGPAAFQGRLGEGIKPILQLS